MSRAGESLINTNINAMLGLITLVLGIGAAVYGIGLLLPLYNTADANQALTVQGFTHIRIHGHAWWACSREDFYSTRFTAVSPQGKPVEGAVCSGLLAKNPYVRW
jgi:hypothetical protein